MSVPSLGIMTFYKNSKGRMEEKPYLLRLLAEARTMNLNVFVFTPEDVDHERQRINAYFLDPDRKKTVRRWTPFPDLIFDRCRYQPTYRYKLLTEFREKYKQFHYLNYPLSDKWNNYKMIEQHKIIRRHLPNTEPLHEEQLIYKYLQRYDMVILKPATGTGGKGILCIRKKGPRLYTVKGRNLKRRITRTRTVRSAVLPKLVKSWIGTRPYIIQQGIDISLPGRRVHDFRLLIQKNGKGRWEVTGGATRIGPQNSVTSNLHGGGKAADMNAFLTRRFGAKRTKRMLKEAHRLCHHTAEELEKHTQRLCEVALDLAIDRQGRIWLLEVNPKPGREVFRKTGQLDTYRQSVIRPLEYALWLHRQIK